ncbi:MAG: transcription antitermination factor NusB [bacterium]
MCFCPNTPVAVVINEALELSKCYSSDDSKRFINGILDHVAKEDLKK